VVHNLHQQAHLVVQVRTTLLQTELQFMRAPAQYARTHWLD
jgi:hypothetical protein